MDRFDYVIVGAGSAGCVLANRLSADPATRVLLLEAGGRAWSPMLKLPLATGKLIRQGAFGWRYATEPMPAAAGRRTFLPRGKVLGGSSAINGMVYMRGHKSDYDAWAQAGNRGWSFADVLPYFRRNEHHESRADEFHGSDGPQWVERAKGEHELFDAFLAAGTQAGWPATDDFNGARQEGFGRFDFTIRDGRRWSAADAYLTPVRGRRNLCIETRAHATRVVLRDGRAVAVAYRKDGMERIAQADAEIVLAAGAIGSPHLLMLSGIGDPAMLKAAGVTPLHPLPGVGRNLQDHAVVPLRWTCPLPLTLHALTRIDRAALAMARAWLFRSGPGSRFPVEAGAFTRSRPGLEAPDLQWHILPGLGSARLRLPRLHGRDPYERHGFLIAIYLLRPESRGEIRLVSPDPDAIPAIFPNFLAAPGDVATLRAGVRDARKLVAQPAFDRYRGEELAPGPDAADDAALDAWIRASADSAHHAVGTCRMGEDPGAVVGADLRVRGLPGLRIADASIMPAIVAGNTNAPAMMIAEKAADLILGRAVPPA